MQESHRLGALGSYYHVWARGLDRKPILLDDHDRRTFLEILAAVLVDAGARCFAVALMTNHYHLLLQTLECALSTVMRRLNFRYARHHNRRYAGTGHVFQGPYGSRLIEDDDHLLTELAYVHLNPVKVNIVRSVDELAKYPWTGHATLMGHPGMDFLEVDAVLGWLAPSAREARQQLVSLLRRCLKRDAGVPAGGEPVPDERQFSDRDAFDLRSKDVQSLLGDSNRLDAVLRLRATELWASMRLTALGWTPLRVLEGVCVRLGVAVSDVRQGRRTRP